MDRKQSFERLSRVLAALNHRLRTPLSVISNDLHYLRTLLPIGEIEGSLEKSRELAGILSESITFGAQPLRIERISLEEIVRESLAALDLEISGCATPIFIETDRERLRICLQQIALCLGKLPQFAKQSIKVKVGETDGKASIWIGHLSTQTPSHSIALPDLLLQALGSDSVIALLLEAFLFSQNATAIVHVSHEAQLVVSFERVHP